jgi:hypothetical protein
MFECNAASLGRGGVVLHNGGPQASALRHQRVWTLGSATSLYAAEVRLPFGTSRWFASICGNYWEGAGEAMHLGRSSAFQLVDLLLCEETYFYLFFHLTPYFQLTPYRG